MAEFAFLFYPGDYLRDTQCLSSNAQVVYDRLICEHVRNLCISQARLNFFTKNCTPDEVEQVVSVLEMTENGYCIRWVVDSINKRTAFSESRRKNRTSKPITSDEHILTHHEDMLTYHKDMEIEIEIEKEEVKEEVKEKRIAKEKNQSSNRLIRYINDKLPNVAGMKVQLTEEEADALLNTSDPHSLNDVLESMENNNELQKKYKSVNLTIRSWLKRRKTNTINTQTNGKSNSKSGDKFANLRNFAESIIQRGEI